MKTPEQKQDCAANQMAEEWADSDIAPQILQSAGPYRLAEESFLAGYQAAKDQLADGGKVMPEWISVKKRLPELPEDRPYYGASACVLITVIAESDQETPINPYVTVAHLMQFKSEEPSWAACACSVIGNCDELSEWKLEHVSHWMPLPEAPKGEG